MPEFADRYQPRTAAGTSVAQESQPLPPCEGCGGEVVTQMRNPAGGRVYLCAACYEQRRQLNATECKVLERLANVPERRGGESAADYLARALRESTR